MNEVIVLRDNTTGIYVHENRNVKSAMLLSRRSDQETRPWIHSIRQTIAVYSAFV